MKPLMIIGILLLFFTVGIVTNCHAQDKTFTLQDSTVEVGALCVVDDIRYTMCCPFGNCYLPENEDILDGIVFFLSCNTNLVIEIGCHTDQRGSEVANLDLSERRAVKMMEALVHMGSNPDQLIVKGYGESQPIHADKQIAEEEDKLKKETLHQVNRRTELKILEVN